MKIQIELEYRTSFGENVILLAGGKRYEMEYICSGLWRKCLNRASFDKYSFEIERNGTVVRTENKPHLLEKDMLKATKAKLDVVFVRDCWHSVPSDSPFYSKMFSNVVFSREAVSDKKSFPNKANVIFSFEEPKIRPNWTIAMIGSGDLFSDWKKPLLMDDSNFPQWRLPISVSESFEYKFVILNKQTKEILFWEEGPNHLFAECPEQNAVLIVKDFRPVFDIPAWKGAGTAIPLFSLRTEDDFGIGEFNDIKKLVDWAVSTGQSIIQLLPINDTENTGTWTDSYPYNANSSFALHPQFIHLPGLGIRRTKKYKEQQKELNALPAVDYEKVNKLKHEYLHKAFKTNWSKVSKTAEFKTFLKNEKEWLLPYALYSVLRDKTGTTDFSQWGKFEHLSSKLLKEGLKKYKKDTDYYIYVQFCLNEQLLDAVKYAHSKGVGIKGDLPIGVSRTSADVWSKPELFNLTGQAGAPPDDFAVDGQNWGFPTYNWDKMAEDGYAWWRARMGKMSEYFDAFRIDHILGFFRIWEIPYDFVTGLSGHFSPAMPYSSDELKDMSFDVESGLYTTPCLEGWVVDEIFGDLAPLVWDKFIVNGHLIDAVATQRKAIHFFDGGVAGKE